MIVKIKDIELGTLEKDRGRYVWWDRVLGTEILPKSYDREGAQHFIAERRGVALEQVTFGRRKVE